MKIDTLAVVPAVEFKSTYFSNKAQTPNPVAAVSARIWGVVASRLVRAYAAMDKAFCYTSPSTL